MKKRKTDKGMRRGVGVRMGIEGWGERGGKRVKVCDAEGEMEIRGGGGREEEEGKKGKGVPRGRGEAEG